jgi:hypothetical protein
MVKTGYGGYNYPRGMIRAVVAHINDPVKEPQPPELRLAIECAKYRSLPHSGGVLDQPMGLLGRMSATLNVYRSVKGYKDCKDSEARESFRRSNPQAFQIYLDTLEVDNGNG